MTTGHLLDDAPEVGLRRSAIDPLDARELDGWLVSGRETEARLRLVDCSPAVKVLIQAPPAGQLARQLGVSLGRAELFEDGFLVCCTAPGEWLLLCPTDPDDFVARFPDMASGEPMGFVDLTDGRTLLRLTGPGATGVLGSLTALDLSDRAFPLGAASTAALAGVRAVIVRDDLFADEAGVDVPGVPAGRDGADTGDGGEAGNGGEDGDGGEADLPEVRSYLICCDRSVGRYLYEQLLDAGRPAGLAEEGYARYRARRADV
jgi:heterotetrameric sarcosine oxidase gamma subunit